MSGLAKQMQLELYIDISSAMLQNQDYSLSQHELELTKVRELKYLQLLNQIPERLQIQGIQQQTLQQLADLPLSLGKTAKIKLYCQLIISSVQTNRLCDSQKYTDSLLGLLEDSSDVQKVNYFLFGVTSLLRLRCYELESNKQYRYDPNTQALMYYILRVVRPEAAAELASKFNRTYEQITVNQRASQLLQEAYIAVNFSDKNEYLDSFIKTLFQKQQYFNKKTLIDNTKKELVMRKVQKVILEKKMGNGKLIQALHLLQSVQHHAFFNLMMQNLAQTNLLKKILDQKNCETPRRQAQKELKLYKKMQQCYGLGDIIKFKHCEVGMSILKYNFRNSEVGWRYVRIGQDGIYWGKEASSCTFKYSWAQVQGLLYGKATTNLIFKCKYISSELIFSLILKERSVDFICQNEEELVTWLQGISHILNKNWSSCKEEAKHHKKAVVTKGWIYWKKLFMKLSVDAAPLLNKSSGVIEKDFVVKYKLKERRSRARSSKA